MGPAGHTAWEEWEGLYRVTRAKAMQLMLRCGNFRQQEKKTSCLSIPDESKLA